MNEIPVLLITYNRLEYSMQALESILRKPGLPIELTVWDNDSTESDMSEWLHAVAASGIKVCQSSKNVGLAPAMNWFFREYADEPYVVKVDNDTVLPDNWVADLMAVMESRRKPFSALREMRSMPPCELGAVSGTCLRPPGLKAADWYAGMTQMPFNSETLYFNPACLGTGVLINMDMIRERGLLFERFPRAPGAGPDDPCLISGWGAYIQEASQYSKWKFAMYSKVPVRLLNLKEDQVLSNDYPEYDAEIQKVRYEGNAWWESVGGLPGVRKYVKEHGGLEQLKSMYWHGMPPVMHISEVGEWPLNPPGPVAYQPISDAAAESEAMEAKKGMLGSYYTHERVMQILGKDGIGNAFDMPASVWSESDHMKECSTFEYWNHRVAEYGTTRSTFLSTPQARINEFTLHHMQVLETYITEGGSEGEPAEVLEVGCGWGRMASTIQRMARSYVGVDFVPALVDKARESMPDLDFRVASAKALPFEDDSFDVVVAIACLSSFGTILDEVLPEMKRVLRPHGRILFLEENFARIDWKLNNA